MVNHFARLSLPAQPWIDPELLKQQFLSLSAASHPDKAEDKTAAESQFKQLNESFNILRNSRSRILHLLEIHGQPRPEHVQNVPAELLSFFSTVAAATQKADAAIKERNAATSPMLKVQLMEGGLEQIDHLQAVSQELRAASTRIEERLLALNSNWPEKPEPALLAELAAAAAALGFLDRWSSQIHERIAALTF